MYRCQSCNKQVPANTPTNTIVTQKRPRQYPFRKDANKKSGKKDDPGGTGYETIKELRVCEDCCKKLVITA